MPNNIAVKFTADVADLTAKSAIARADMQATTKALNDLAKQTLATGMTTELQSSMLAAGDAAARARSQYAKVSAELAKFRPAAEGAMYASAGVTRELLVMGRELARGNFNRMAGSATILAGRLGVLTPSFLATAAGIGAVAAPAVILAGTLGYLAYQAYEAHKAAEGMAEAYALTGRSAGNSADQVYANVDALAALADVSRTTAQALIEFDATHAQVDARLANAANQLIPQFTKAFGEKGVEELNKFKGSLAGISEGTTEQAIRKFNDLNSTMLNFKPAQVQLIEGMIQSGNRIGAVTEILAEFAAQGGAHITSVRDQIIQTQRELATAQQKAAALAEEASRNVNPRLLTAIQAEAGRAAADVAELQHRLKDLQAISASSDSGESLSAAFENSHATLMSLRDSATRAKDAVAELHREMEQRRAANPQDKEANDYFANQTKIDADLAHREDPGDFKKPKAPKAKDDAVQQWTEQLREQEIAGNNYFRDATADELKFWQGKLALVTAGSKDWLAVQGKIFEASKTLARQAYQDQIADYNDKIAADRDNWTKEEADWQAKLAYIKSTFGAQSSEYKNAYREMEEAQREHDEKELRAAQEHVNKLIAETKRGLDEAAKAREDDARAAETLIKANAGASPFGEISADAQVAQIHRQLNEQKIADNESLYTAQSALLDDEIAKAVAKYGEDKTQYQALLDQKAAADQAYASKKRELDAQLRLQSIQDNLAMKQSYDSYISGTVSTTVSGFDKLISGQKTWSQVGISIYQSVVREAEQQVSKMVTHWITQHLLMSSAQKAQLAVQQSAQAAASSTAIATQAAASKAQVTVLAGLAGAGGVASMAAAPWPLDMTAPAFGAEMSAAAMSLGSFAQGTNVVPADMIAQIHAGERIIPKADNEALMQTVARGANGDGSNGSNGSNGSITNHFSPTVHANGADGKAIVEALEGNFSDFTRLIKRAARNGALR